MLAFEKKSCRRRLAVEAEVRWLCNRIAPVADRDAGGMALVRRIRGNANQVLATFS